MRTFVFNLVVAVAITVMAAAQERGIGQPVAASGAGPSGKRVALVIGNSKYENSPLTNPANDATDMAAILKKSGFAVTLKTDCDQRTMRDALDTFGSTIPKDGVALFFYAGHGMQSNGRNYLVPLGVAPKGPGDLQYDCVDAGLILAKLEDGGAKLNLIVLDACRNNPFARSWSRAVPSGLATMDPPGGSIMIYATAAGSVAEDGSGRNGLFTGALLKNMGVPGADVVDIFRKAAEEVKSTSKGEQAPMLALTFTGNFTFIQANTVNVTTPEADKPVMTSAPKGPTMTGNLMVGVNAPSAKVKVDGKDVGIATLEKGLPVPRLPAGKVTVEIEADGYEPTSEQVEIPAGDKWIELPVILAKVMVVKPSQPKRPPTVSVGGEPRQGEEQTFAGIQFVWIPPGTFTMGSPASEEGRSDDETQHAVTLTRGFWLGKYEVTQAQWTAMFGRNPSNFKGDDLPVEQVSWDECQDFIRKLNRRGEGTFRLPTEAEWEYACRAGAQTRFSIGDSETQLGNVAWYSQNSNDSTHPVGKKQENIWGVFDMHGNVYEWCADWYGDYLPGAVTDPQGPTSGQYRVLRGGSWNGTPGNCRAAGRYFDTPDLRYTPLGFRLLRTQN